MDTSKIYTAAVSDFICVASSVCVLIIRFLILFILGNVYDVGKKYLCKGCNKWYKHLRSLRRHHKYECNKEPGFICTFEGCAYKSKLKENLKHHVIRKHNRNIVI